MGGDGHGMALGVLRVEIYHLRFTVAVHLAACPNLSIRAEIPCVAPSISVDAALGARRTQRHLSLGVIGGYVHSVA